MKTLVHVNPLNDFRAIDEVFERLFGRAPAAVSPTATPLAIDVFEKDGKFNVRASVAGVDPSNLDIQIENNVLTIRGETKSEYEDSNVKVYRREVSYGSFARSIRLPENLNAEEAEAQFTNGFVTISIPKVEEEKPKAFKVQVKSVNDLPTEPQILPSETEESAH